MIEPVVFLAVLHSPLFFAYLTVIGLHFFRAFLTGLQDEQDSGRELSFFWAFGGWIFLILGLVRSVLYRLENEPQSEKHFHFIVSTRGSLIRAHTVSQGSLSVLDVGCVPTQKH